MLGYVANTDNDWFDFFADKQMDKVNFWFPSDFYTVRAEPGSVWFFRLKAPRNVIGGFGIVERFEKLQSQLAWEHFEQRNGAATFEDFQRRLSKQRDRSRIQQRGKLPRIGCLSLSAAVFFSESSWIPQPSDWKPTNLRYAEYPLTTGEGQRIWQECQERTSPLRLPPSKSDEELSAIVRPLRQGRGQGRGLTGDERKAVERRAMVVVEEELRKEWPSVEVEDVSATESCDFICSSGNRKLFVEVKGTTGAGEKVTVTRREVALARDKRPNTLLAVVSKIKLSRKTTPPEASEGEISCIEFPWEPKDDDLEALAFDYRVRIGRSKRWND